ncbi:MAG: PHP domain-containing protein [Candidatus Atabeyarchaeum deiterrae]
MKHLKLDLHVHTWYSKDGIHSPELVLRSAASKGLHVVAITDHNTVRGSKEARKCKTGVLVIPGIEVDTKEGHIIGLGIEDVIKPWLSAAETVDLIRDAGGTVVIPHPFDYIRRGIGSMAKILKADAIEVMNSKTNTPLSNTFAKRLAKKINSPITAGSDAHLAEDVGNAYMIIQPRENPNVNMILKMLRTQKSNTVEIVGRITPLSSRVKKIALQAVKKSVH